MIKLLIATSNLGKQKEFQALLTGLPFEISTPEEVGIDLEVAETGNHYAENAVLKARAYAAASGLASLADDSGLEVAALGGAPGIYSARWTGSHAASDQERRLRLLSQLEAHPRPWTACFCCVVAVAFPGGRVIWRKGTCPGEIIPEERGKNGFGYDPIFLVEGTNQTMAELPLEEKNQISHRARAVQALRASLMRMHAPLDS